MPRRTMWIDMLSDFSIASGGQNVEDLDPDNQLSSRGMTLIRTILCHDYSYTVHDAGEGSQIIDIGIGITAEEAFTADVVADPSTRLDFPPMGWVYRCRHKLHGFAADQPAFDVRSVYRDLKSQRKMDRQHPYLVVDNTPDSGTASAVHMVGITRMLYLLP